MAAEAPTDVATRAGTVALVGRPNAGKSTLLNALVGERLSIVTPRAQTTWRRVVGIRTTERTQLVLVDTPGLLEARDLLQRAMLTEARQAAHDADLVVLVIDATRPLEDALHSSAKAELDAVRGHRFVAVNKTDLATPPQISQTLAWARSDPACAVFPLSAATGRGVDALAQALEAAAPTSPFLYPDDDIAAQPLRFFAAEIVRETVFEQFRQEIPYAVFCTVEDFREQQDPVYVQANLYVERRSQKQILVGRKGAGIRELGRAARKKLEDLMGRPVYLDLWVKILPGWRRKREHLSRFGFHVQDEDDAI